MSPTTKRTPRRLLYVANEDFAFPLNRPPMARAAREAGFEVRVATRVDKGARAIEDEGFVLHPIPFRRGDIPILCNTFHQNIGFVLGLGLLAALGLASNRVKLILVCGALPILLLFLFHIATRTALVALVSGFLFLAFAACWVYSKKAAALASPQRSLR